MVSTKVSINFYGNLKISRIIFVTFFRSLESTQLSFLFMVKKVKRVDIEYKNERQCAKKSDIVKVQLIKKATEEVSELKHNVDDSKEKPPADDLLTPAEMKLKNWQIGASNYIRQGLGFLADNHRCGSVRYLADQAERLIAHTIYRLVASVY